MLESEALAETGGLGSPASHGLANRARAASQAWSASPGRDLATWPAAALIPEATLPRRTRSDTEISRDVAVVSGAMTPASS